MPGEVAQVERGHGRGAVVARVVEILHVGGVEGLLVVPDAVVVVAFDGHGPDVAPAAGDVAVDVVGGVGQRGDGDGDIGMPDLGKVRLRIDRVDVESEGESCGGGGGGVGGADGVGVALAQSRIHLIGLDDRGIDGSGAGSATVILQCGEGEVGLVESGELGALRFDFIGHGIHESLLALVDLLLVVLGDLVERLAGGGPGARFKGLAVGGGTVGPLDDGELHLVDVVDDEGEDLLFGALGESPFLDELHEAFAVGSGRAGPAGAGAAPFM